MTSSISAPADTQIVAFDRGPGDRHAETNGFWVAAAILLTALAMAVIADLCVSWTTSPGMAALAERIAPALRLLTMPDVWVFLLLAGAGLSLTRAFPDRVSLGGAILGAALATLFLVGNAAFFGAPFWPIYWPDSLTYLLEHPCRSFGYATLLAPFRGADPRLVVILQFNALVASLALLAIAVARVTGRPLLGGCLLLLGAVTTDIWASAFSILTEAPLGALLAAWAAFLVLALHSGRVAFMVAASIVAAIAITINPHTAFLLAPMAFAVHAGTASWRRHLVAALPAIVIALAATSFHSHRVTGNWSPFSLDSFLLAQHMSWAADADAVGPAAETVRQVAAQLPVVAKSPPDAWHVGYYVRYVFHHMSSYRTATSAAVSKVSGRKVELCKPESTAAYADLASQFVGSRPFGYVQQVLAFYLGSWSAMTPGPHALSLSHLTPQTWTAQARWVRTRAVGTEFEQVAERIAGEWQTQWQLPDEMRPRVAALANLEKGQRSLLLDHLQSIRATCVDCQVALFYLIGIVATAASFLLLVPGLCSGNMRAAALLLAMSSVYLGAGALVSVPMARYSTPVVWLVAAGFLLMVPSLIAYRKRRREEATRNAQPAT